MRLFGGVLCATVLLTGLGFGQNPQYSDKDKKKLADIAQRPEVQKAIAAKWDDVRRTDMDYAFHVNRSSALASVTDPEFQAKYGQIYDNPAVQLYVDSIGQRLVPKGSVNTLNFRVLLDPIPRAESLSTGTVYVSTGLIALLDDEAQLSYVLGHEVAHIEKEHEYNRIRNTILEENLGQEKDADVAKKRAMFSAVTAVAGAAMGGALGGGSGAVAGAVLGGAGGLIASTFLIRNHFQPTEWSNVEENEADQYGMKYMLDEQYDPREVPRMLARLNKTVSQDSRVGLGFIGSPDRVKERITNMQTLLNGDLKTSIDAKLKSAALVTSSPQFPMLMEALKRDNGIEAMDYDLFAMSRDNLEDAISINEGDARAQSYLGRLLLMTGRGDDEHKAAMDHLQKAIALDTSRGAYPEPHLDRALMLMQQHTASTDADAQMELKTYVALYQREHEGQVPPNMHVIYDYVTFTGDPKWYLAPATSVTTRNGEAVMTTSSATAQPTPTPQDVVMRVTGKPGSGSVVSTGASGGTTPAHTVRTSVKKPE